MFELADNFKESFQGHSGAIYYCVSDQKHLYSASGDKHVVRWDLTTGEQDQFVIKTESTPYTLLIDGENNYLWIGLASGDIHVIDIENKIEVKFFKVGKSSIFALAKNPKNNQILAGDKDGNIHLFDRENLNYLSTLPLDCGKIRRINFDNQGTKFSVCGGNGSILILNAEDYQILNKFPGHEGGTTASIFSPENNNLLYTAGKDAHIKLWDLNLEKCLISIPAHNYVIYDLIILDDLLISASRDKSIKIWDLDTLNPVQKLGVKNKGHNFSVNALTAIGTFRFVSCSDDKKLKYWTKIDNFDPNVFADIITNISRKK